MGQYVGLDVSLETTKVHVLDDQGKRVWRGTCVTHPTAIEATIRKHAPEVVRIGLDADDLAVAGADRRRLACLDARQAKAALNMRINKTMMPRVWRNWCGPAATARCGSRAARPCWCAR